MTNDNIDEGDAIIIYFSGYGSRVTAPIGWAATDGRIETLCPYDDGMIDENGETIHGIPDRTINTLLRELAAIKGNNIVRLMASHPSGTTDLHCPFFSRPSLLTLAMQAGSRAKHPTKLLSQYASSKHHPKP